jgi:guanine deaminase
LGLAAIEQPIGDTPCAADALCAATISGARALGFPDLGSLAPGMKADIVLFRLDDIAFVPLNSAIRQLIFGDAAPALDKVIVDGRLVVDDGLLLTIDLGTLRSEAERYAGDLRSELKTITERVKPLFPAIERALKRAYATDWRLVG